MKIQCSLIGIALALNSASAATTADQWVAQGRTNLAAHTMPGLITANVCFSNAVALNPVHQEANALYATTRLLTLPAQGQPLDSFLTRLGVDALGRDLYHWTARFSTDADGTWMPPANVSAAEAPAQFRTNVIPQIIGAAGNLAQVTNTTFLLNLTSNETALADVTLDYGDILMLRAMFQAAEYLGYLTCGMNSDVPLAEAQALLTNHAQGVQCLLANYPQLLTFATTNDLVSARQAFMNAVDLYVQASAFIRSRPANTIRLFTYDPTMQTAETDFRQTLLDLRSSLTNPTVWRLYTNYTFNLARQFDGTHPLRDFLPAFTNNTPIEGTVPDPTFGGLITGLSAGEVDQFMFQHFHARSSDARWWLVAKSRNFVQTGTAQPVVDVLGPYSFTALVEPSAGGMVTNADLTPPGGVRRPLLAVGQTTSDNTTWPTMFLTAAAFGTATDIDAAYPNGVYGLTIFATSEGTRSVALTLTNNLYPSTPHIANFGPAQAIAPSQDFVLRWDPMVGGTTNNFIQVKILSESPVGGGFAMSTEVFKTPDPWNVDALNGTATAVTISANQLSPGTVFYATIQFATFTDSDRRTFRTGRGVAAYCKTTAFTLQTTDLRSFSVAKGQNYIQTNSSSLSLITNGAFSFRAWVDDMTYGDVTDLAVLTPAGRVDRASGNGSLTIAKSFNSKPSLDAAYPNGNYTMTINSSFMGEHSAVLTLTNDAYPNTPRISNYTDAQHIDNTSSFTLTWDPFVGGTTNSFVQVIITGPGYSYFSSPAYREEGALDGTSTNWVIRRKNLYAGQTYQATLLFAKGITMNTNGYPAAPGVAAYYKTTTLQIHADKGLPSPDLAPVALTWTNTPAWTNPPAPGQPVQVAVTVTNQGTDNVYGWRYEFYLSRDGIIGASDAPFDSEYADGLFLQPGASVTNTFPVTLSSGPVSNCFLVVRLTPWAYEVRTDNNTLAVPITLSGPDLVAMSLDWAGPSEPSSSIDVSWAVTNLSMEAASAYNWSWGGWFDSIYVSTNADGQNGRQLGGAYSYYSSDNPLAPGDGYAQITSVRLPGLAPGNYYLSLHVDDFQNVREVCRTNNTLVRQITLIAPATAPDLLPTALITNGLPRAGEALPISILVTNRGTGPAEPSWQYEVYLSAGPQWDASSQYMGAGWANDELLPGDTLSLASTINLPEGAVGLRYLIVRLDTQDDIYELNETNNLLAVPVVIIQAPPRITQQPASLSVYEGAQAVFTVGAVHAQTYQWRYNGSDVGGATRSALLLDPARTFNSGQYSVRVGNSVDTVLSGEASLQVVTATSGPDLVPTVLAAPPTADWGQFFQVSWTVTNRGNLTALPNYGGWVDILYVSTTSTLDASAIPIAFVMQPGALAPGASYTQSSMVAVPPNLPLGPWHLILRVNNDNPTPETNIFNNVLTVPLSPAHIVVDNANVWFTLDVNAGDFTNLVWWRGSGQQLCDRPWNDQRSGGPTTMSFAYYRTNWSLASYFSTANSYDIVLSHPLAGQKELSCTWGTSGIFVDASLTTPLAPVPEIGGYWRPGGSTGDTNDYATVFDGNGEVFTNLPVTYPGDDTNLWSGTSQSCCLQDMEYNEVIGYVYDDLVPVRVGTGASANGPFLSSTTNRVTFQLMVTSTDEFAMRAGGRVNGRILSPAHSVQILAGDTLRFAGRGTVMPGYGPARFAWDFGGGLSSLLQEPGLVTFPTPGTNRVVLDVSDNAGRHDPTPDTRIITVVADPGPVPDLAVMGLSVPPGLAIGQPAQVTYWLQNVGNGALSGKTWHDAVYLSRDPYLDVSDTLLAQVVVTNDVPAGGSYTNTLAVTMPPLDEGVYYLVLSADDQGELLERHKLNNQSAVVTTLVIPVLTNGIAETNTFAGDGDRQYYRVDVPSGQNLLVTLNEAGDQGVTELYLRYGSIPTRSSYDYRSTGPVGPNQLVLAPNAQAGPWYILAYASRAGSGPYAILAQVGGLFISKVTPDHLGWGHDSVMSLAGAGFVPGMAVELLATNGTAYPAAAVTVESTTQMVAKFGSNTVPVGTYLVQARTPGGLTALAPGTFRMVESLGPRLVTRLILPAWLGYHVASTLYVEYSNEGDDAMLAPLLAVSGTQEGQQEAILTLHARGMGRSFSTSIMPNGFRSTVQILASGATPGLLQPGETVRVPIYYAGWLRPWNFHYPPIQFTVSVVTADDGRAIDWAQLAPTLRPIGMSDADWAVVLPALETRMGNTWGGYVAQLYGVLGQATSLNGFAYDAEQLFDLVFQQITNYPPPPPPIPPPGGGDSGSTQPVGSSDPNGKIGSVAYGPDGFIPNGALLAYEIRFENETNATAPAQLVEIYDPLDQYLDLSSFALTEIGFGTNQIVVPENSQYFQTNMPVTVNGAAVEVQVEVGIDFDLGALYATFRTIDPATGLPPEVTIGFLPPEDGTGRGQGHISYTISPSLNLPTGTQIRNVAHITFDRGTTIATNQRNPHDPSQGTDPAKECLYTIDATTPVSRVLPLPAATNRVDFLVGWSGDDAGGSGVVAFDIYVSDNSGPWTVWQSATTNAAATYHGEVGHTYGFYSSAQNGVGTQEPSHARPDMIIRLMVPLTINISGCGTVTPGAGGTTSWEPGAAVRTIASPCPGWAFAAWSGDFSSASPTLDFVIHTGMVLNASFIRKEYTPTNGTYTGLFYDTNGVSLDSSGLFTMTVTVSKKTGAKFTGKLQMGNSRLSFSGTFDTFGHAAVVVKRGQQEAATMDLQMDTASGAAWMVGSLGHAAWRAELMADRAVFSSRNPATQFAGKYTVLIPAGGGDAEPQGDGYGTVSVSTGGTVKLLGRLPDGTSISQTAPVCRNGDWPLYIPLYNGKGSLLGWVIFARRSAEGDRPADDVHGQLSWIVLAGGSRYYPAGFSNDAIMASGNRYTPPAKGHRIIEVADGLISFSGGALTTPFTNTVTISTANKVVNSSANKLSLTFTGSSGLFSGSVTVPGTKHSFSYNGVVLQGRNVGLGYFMDKNPSGKVSLVPR
jgi:hypothetical protein